MQDSKPHVDALISHVGGKSLEEFDPDESKPTILSTPSNEEPGADLEQYLADGGYDDTLITEPTDVPYGNDEGFSWLPEWLAGPDVLFSEEDQSITNANNLNKKLGSEQQLSEKGIPIAGAGTEVELRDVDRLINNYGGAPSDWSKYTSSQHEAPDGRKFETHWYQNNKTSKKYESKTILRNY